MRRSTMPSRSVLARAKDNKPTNAERGRLSKIEIDQARTHRRQRTVSRLHTHAL